MSQDALKRKISPARDFARLANKANAAPGFVFPCLVQTNGPLNTLPQGVNPSSAFGNFVTLRLTYDQLENVADDPNVVSFTIR